ncbi:MAG: VOC family protein, partial [Selenomonadaceae bacterium]|nr:VOC family protein [Selenomonadaceae bacterium]
MFRFAHNNLNVLDLERSIKFYRDALDLHEVGGIDGGDDFKIVYLGDSFGSPH